MISANCLLQKQQYIHGLKHDIIAPCSIIPIIIIEFHNSHSDYGTIPTFKAIRFYCWPKLLHDIVKYINTCDICDKYLPTKAFRKTISPNGSSGNGHYTSSTSYIHRTMLGFNNIMLAHVICIFILMKEKPAENAVQAYISGIFTHETSSIAILSASGT